MNVAQLQLSVVRRNGFVQDLWTTACANVTFTARAAEIRKKFRHRRFNSDSVINFLCHRPNILSAASFQSISCRGNFCQQTTRRRSRWLRASSERSTERAKNSFPQPIPATNVFVIKTSITQQSLIILTVASSIAKSTCDINHSCNVDACQFSPVKNAARSTGNAVSLHLFHSPISLLFSLLLDHKSNCFYPNQPKLTKRSSKDQPMEMNRRMHPSRKFSSSRRRRTCRNTWTSLS